MVLVPMTMAMMMRTLSYIAMLSTTLSSQCRQPGRLGLTVKKGLGFRGLGFRV